MHLGEPAGKKAKRVVWGVIAVLSLLFLIAFWKDILGIFQALMGNGDLVAPSVSFVFFNCIFGFFGVFILWVILISFQALLPISNILTNPAQALLEAYRASWYMLFYILRLHGPAIFVKDGQRVETSEDLKREDWPGVVVVDFNSAVVLEERNAAPGLNGAFSNLTVRLLSLLQVFDRRQSPRVRGSGIVYTRPRERIRGVVDLRRQFRMQTNVRCYTRDGIELDGNVWSIFTIGPNEQGQDADVVQVTYVGAPAPENLRVVTFASLPNGFLRITGFNDDLDEADRREIHEFWQRGLVEINGQRAYPAFTPYHPPEALDDVFARRVYAAVCSQARSGTELLPWTELPTRVAAGFFRELLSQTNYDELYDVRQVGEFPLPRFTASLRLRMRNNGILSFRLVRSTAPAQADPGTTLVRGRVYRETELQVSQVRRLQNPKVLRDRGIRVIASGFGDLIPVNEEVYKQRLDAWQAGWEREFEENMANSDRSAMLARGRAQIEAQQNLWSSLSDLFDSNEHTDEALAMRLFQALDTAAADPRTRALLPNHTIDLLRYLKDLLLQPGAGGAANRNVPMPPIEGTLPPGTNQQLPPGNGGTP